MKKIKLSIIFALANLVAASQPQNKIWYFGDHAGITFNTLPPSALNDGVFIQAEGVASICDNNGKLLFFTDGVSVWNANRLRMNNGYGLLGHNSATQSALIVPKPGDCSTYYIFTVPAEDSITPMSYSIVDMNLNSGLGDITLKNVPLFAPVTERLTATLKKNGIDYWVVAQEYKTNNYLVFSVTANGVNPTPVRSQAGTASRDILDVLGYMKFSSNGKWLAYCSPYSNGLTELFNFDNSTGIVSNGITLATEFAYGIEFSPDNSKLYTSTINAPFMLYQYDLLGGAPDAIRNSRKVIFSTSLSNPQYGGALQLGPDNKIYVNRLTRNFVGVINNPNIAGIGCNYVDNGVSLNGKLCQDGLPNAIKNYAPCESADTSMCFLSADITLYPAPFNTILMIDKPPANCQVKLALFNGLGQLLLKDVILNDGLNRIPLYGLPAATYFYILYAGKKRLQSGKILRQ